MSPTAQLGHSSQTELQTQLFEVVPPEAESDLAPHPELQRVSWLRRDYWTNLVPQIWNWSAKRSLQ